MLTIGLLAKKAECSVPTIRYYESVGLMPQAGRRPGGHRTYGYSDLAQLVFIRRCREMDMPIERIRDLLGLQSANRPCAETRAFFQSQRDAVQARIQSLKDLDVLLSLYLVGCDEGCGPSAQPCNIFDRIEAG